MKKGSNTTSSQEGFWGREVMELARAAGLSILGKCLTYRYISTGAMGRRGSDERSLGLLAVAALTLCVLVCVF